MRSDHLSGPGAGHGHATPARAGRARALGARSGWRRTRCRASPRVRAGPRRTRPRGRGHEERHQDPHQPADPPRAVGGSATTRAAHCASVGRTLTGSRCSRAASRSWVYIDIVNPRLPVVPGRRRDAHASPHCSSSRRFPSADPRRGHGSACAHEEAPGRAGGPNVPGFRGRGPRPHVPGIGKWRPRGVAAILQAPLSGKRKVSWSFC